MSFFLEFGKDAVEVVPVEADAGCFAGELEGFEESWHGAGNAVEKGFWEIPGSMAAPDLARSSFLICSQFRRTSAAELALVLPNTCGWRRIIFS